MKLVSCHVENFGKLSDFTMDFAEGINVINESNAWGKSTLAAFLKAMFYGLDSKKDPKAFEKERNLYRPWQGGSFGGELDFEIGGKRYRISRSFGRTEKADEFHLYDLSTNLESHDFSSEIGVEIFDLDSASFKRSIYIAQNDCASETSDSINAKLGNLAENTNDINNFESAGKRLKELLNQLTPERVTGSIKKRKNYITQLTQEIRSLDSAKTGYEGISIKKRAMDSQIEELLQIRKSYADALVIASEDSRKQELYKQYDALCRDEKEKEEALSSFAKVFPKELPPKHELDEQLQNVRGLEELHTSMGHLELTPEEQEKEKVLSHMFGDKKPTPEAIDAAISALLDVDQLKDEMNRQQAHLGVSEGKIRDIKERPLPTQGTGGYKAFIYGGIAVLLVGIAAVALGYFDPWMIPQSQMIFIGGVVTEVLGFIFIIVGTVLKEKAKKARALWQEEQDRELDAVESELLQLSGNITKIQENARDVLKTIRTFLETYHVSCENGNYQLKLYELKSSLTEFERLEEKQRKYKALQNQYQEKLATVRAFALSYDLYLGEDLMSQMTHLQNKAVEYRIAKGAYAESVKKKEAFENAREKSFWTKEAACPYSLEELNEMIAQADEKIESLKLAQGQYKKQLEDLQEQLDARDDKALELEEQLEKQEEETKRYHLAKLTQEFLQKAKEQFVSKYMEPISRGFSKYYSMLTGDTRGEWMIDANMNLMVREYGELRDTGWLSAGYQDLIGVCMRLALVDAMYQEEKPFLILDDPFVNLDQEKVACGNHLLLSVANEYQVIYFTCHDSRSPL